MLQPAGNSPILFDGSGSRRPLTGALVPNVSSAVGFEVLPVYNVFYTSSVTDGSVPSGGYQWLTVRQFSGDTGIS